MHGDLSEDLGVGDRILKWLKEWDYSVDSSGSGYGGLGNEPSGSIKCWDDQLGKY
jgi:hypothetical protein